MTDKMENIADIIKRIIEIPLKIHEQYNKSQYQIIIETKYIDYYNKINIENIKNALLGNDKLIQHWYNYSSDKRTSNGYFLSENNYIYEIGYIKNRKYEIINTFSLKLDACANFIKIELEDFRERNFP
jgi:hypothetical protein